MLKFLTNLSGGVMHPCRVTRAQPKEPLPDWLAPTGPLTEQEIALLALELIGIILLVELPRVIRRRLRLSLTHRPARIHSRSNVLLSQGRTFRRPESIDRSPPPWRRWRIQALHVTRRWWTRVVRDIFPLQRKLVPPPHTV
ncbi:MAG: hypothetical protein QG668_507 [Patescibacteria group bacterium]|nr:hypothetical protein [Patescibacteria group bacterium]